MNVPFDVARFDRLLDEQGVDAVLVTSKHNLQYLLGGYRSVHIHWEAHSLGRFLPLLGYSKGSADRSFYVSSLIDGIQIEVEPLWPPAIECKSWTAADSAATAAVKLKERGLERATIAIEREFLPDAASSVLASELSAVRFVDATWILDELRAVKTPAELDLMRVAADGVTASIEAVFASAAPGATKAELVEQLRLEQTRRGLEFHVCFPSTGTSLNRMPSGERWEDGAICCIDSHGDAHGYIADITRMGSMGPASAQMEQSLGEVEAVQQAAREGIGAGRLGREIVEQARAALAECGRSQHMTFAAHGIGLVAHESPRLISDAPMTYPPTHYDLPLEAGMVLSIETDVRDPELGFVKLEDLLVVTAEGWEAFGDGARGWNVPARAPVTA